MKYCGEIGTSSEISTPFSIITNTNNVNLRFYSIGGVTRTGFLAIWSPYDLDEIPTGCNNCDFPFTFGDATFDTCISVLGVDTQSWCSLTPPVINDPLKISCSDSDSSCPSSPPQTVITSPNYPLNYPNSFDQVE